MKLPVYLDHHATTPVDPRVFKAMEPYFSEFFGNPASVTHSFGWQAEEAVKIARRQVADLIHADPKEIVWTSGTTEAINLALLGTAPIYREKGNHLITCAIEHRAVLETMEALKEKGFRVTFLPVDATGLLDPEAVRREITDKTILISLMAANNEIGTIFPLTEIGKIAREKKILFHVDAAQGCGKIPIDVEAMNIDLCSMSAHKVYGPKGVGALYVRNRPKVRIAPILYGGKQEGTLRPGTLAVPNIVGMGKAFEIAGQEMASEGKRIAALRDRLHEGLKKKLTGIHLNGDPTCRLSGNLNISFDGVKAVDLMAKLKNVAVSSGAACASGSLEPSYVIRALGVGDERALSSIRFGIGRFNTVEEIDFAINEIVEIVQTVQALR
jgi:cysteine desulfurase